MELKNKIMLITYADSMGKNIKELHEILDTHYKEAVGGVHILPFFPSSADRGFAPKCYDKVEESFGTFEDVEAFGKEYYLMFDFMVNHISAGSEYFQDFLEKKEESAYKDFFIRYSEFWEGGEPTQEQVDKIYKRKPRAPYIEAEFKDGTREKIWCTFCEEQIDLDVSKEAVRQFIRDTLKNMCRRGASIIRLDAFAYAVKKADTSCFFIEPDIWDLLYEIEGIVKEEHGEILPEIHEHYTIPMKIAEKGFWIYDFALPVLTLHALYNHTGEYLKQWLERCPMKQFTTLDTHDGIGIVDVKALFGASSVRDTQNIDLVIRLEDWDKDKEYDRLGLEEEYTEYLGNRVVCHSIPIRPGRNLAIICESAAVNHRQKKMGYNAAQELYKRVQNSLAHGREDDD